MELSEEIKELLLEFSQIETIGQLEYLRKQTANLMLSGNEEQFITLQNAFKAARNRLERITWAKRPANWDEVKPRI